MNWDDPKTKIAKYFTMKEALFLPTWNRMATNADGMTDKIKSNLLKTFTVMDKIREFFGKPVIIHVAYRPTPYNTLIGGAKKSGHLFGLAVDFHIKGMTSDEVRKQLKEKLEEWKIRMEDLPGSSWIHIDLKTVHTGSPRLFKP